VVVWKNAKHKGFLKTINDYFFQGAIDIDRFANRNFRTLWNSILRKTAGHAFGNPAETISSALGKNQRDDKLSVVGWIVVYILWGLDYKYWKKGGHCINSIQ